MMGRSYSLTTPKDCFSLFEASHPGGLAESREYSLRIILNCRNSADLPHLHVRTACLLATEGLEPSLRITESGF